MKSFIGLFLVLVLSILSCQQEKTTFEEYDFKLEGYDWDGDPYKFSSYIQDSIIEISGAQKAAWEYSYIGDIENMHKSWDRDYQNTREVSQQVRDTMALLSIVNAQEYILERAKDYQVVIINEAHHMPQHRVFTTRLLEDLKAQGFKHLGLETFFASETNDSTLQANGYPILTTGYYSKEPQFGNLIREALHSDYKVFGYESQGHANGKEREINQARNIQEYLSKYPDEKLIIHCGFDHGYEGDMSNSWEKAMAGRLTEFTGIDPLTITQTVFSERSSLDLESPYYQLVDVPEASVFLDEEGKSFGDYRSGSWFDIAVFHPRSGGFDRPKWMVYGERKELAYSFMDADINCPCLVFAYKEGEEIGTAVPYDIQETSDKTLTFVLDESNFEIVILNEEGRALKSRLVNRK